MENVNYKQEVVINSHPLKTPGEKATTNLQRLGVAMKDFSAASQINARLGVTIDWSKGTMIVQATN